jgi:hypothetical protein
MDWKKVASFQILSNFQPEILGNFVFFYINSSNFAKILIPQKLRKQNLGGVNLKGGGLSSSMWNHTNGI